MIRLILTGAFTITTAITSGAAPAESQTFGEAISLTEKTPLAEALQSPVKDQDILVAGLIHQVCEKKGCWMSMRDGESEVRITFKGYSFFVPKDSAGKKVLAQGRMIEKTESVAAQRHFLKDAGASKEALASIQTPKKVKSFIASGLQIHP